MRDWLVRLATAYAAAIIAVCAARLITGRLPPDELTSVLIGVFAVGWAELNED